MQRAASAPAAAGACLVRSSDAIGSAEVEAAQARPDTPLKPLDTAPAPSQAAAQNGTQRAGICGSRPVSILTKGVCRLLGLLQMCSGFCGGCRGTLHKKNQQIIQANWGSNLKLPGALIFFMYMAAGRRGIIEGVRQRLMAYLFLHSCSKNGDAEARKLFFYHFEDYANLAMWKVGIFTFVAPCCAASEHCMSQLPKAWWGQVSSSRRFKTHLAPAGHLADCTFIPIVKLHDLR